MEQEKIPLLVVAGPTASGKTDLAVSLALEFGGEVVSADSMQIYRQMDIATAKPTPEEMKGVPHHLIGFLSPDVDFSVAQYVQMASAAIRDIHARGKLPILAGGTGLYVSSLIDHIDFSHIKSDEGIRRELEAVAQEHGSGVLWNMLVQVDPELAEKLHANNVGRVIRAIEVHRITGISMSEHQRNSRCRPSPYKLCMLGLGFENRQKLYDRINLRVDRMVEQGLLAEAQNLHSVFGTTAHQAIGYKELDAYFAGECTLEQALEHLKMSTRRYAKRQLTWFRRDERIDWILRDCMDENQILEFSKNRVFQRQIL